MKKLTKSKQNYPSLKSTEKCRTVTTSSSSAMSERAGRRGAGAPFYLPPRRQTSAEIISEARAAVYGDTSSASSVTGVAGGAGLRPLRTRRPFTPRDAQRTLFTDRAEPRPPSAFNLKYVSPSEGAAALDAGDLKGILLTEPLGSHARKKPAPRGQPRPLQPADSWGGGARLPQLSGRSKPLHRRGTCTSAGDDLKSETLLELTSAIMVTQPLGYTASGASGDYSDKSPSPDPTSKRKQYTGGRSASDAVAPTDVTVRQLSVQMPSAFSAERVESLSILELSEVLTQKSRDTERTLLLMGALQAALETARPSGSLREFTLRSLYTHIDSVDERVLVAIARAMLTLRVTGPHLAAACKLVFKLARNDKNDHFFINTNLLELLVEGCGRADPITEAECCIYGAGALRFLALEPALRARAHRAGAADLLVLHLKILNTAKEDNPRGLSDQSSHALYQLTGALRNLAGDAAAARGGDAAARGGALPELQRALTLHHTDRDVLTNVVRCLSVLSSDPTCCASLCAQEGSARALLTSLAQCASRAPLALRLAYTLGNMAAADDGVRVDIYSMEGGVDTLLTVLESYTERARGPGDPEADPDLHLIGSDLCGSDGSNEDVLIKTVRVIANLCLSWRVGAALASSHCGRVCRAALACLRAPRRSPAPSATTDYEDTNDSTHEDRRHELATAVLATVNNVTFYRDHAAPAPPLLEDIARETCSWLGESAAGGEAVRALGNLSRAAPLAQLLALEGALPRLAPLLTHEESSVRCAAAGVLVNMCGAGVAAAAPAATHALELSAESRDAAMAALLARALWNAHSHGALSVSDGRRAADALTVFIDDDSVFAACEAFRNSDRHASNPELSKLHVKLPDKALNAQTLPKSCSVDRDLNLDCDDREDLGFEEGDIYEEGEVEEGAGCECGPCHRLAAWEELAAVALPLLEKLRPVKADASVGTD